MQCQMSNHKNIETQESQKEPFSALPLAYAAHFNCCNIYCCTVSSGIILRTAVGQGSSDNDTSDNITTVTTTVRRVEYGTAKLRPLWLYGREAFNQDQ